MMSNQELRLQKYLARCGIASRRASENLILDGRISVNDKVTTKMGTKINPSCDVVKFDGQVIKPIDKDVTIVLNKPAGYVSTMSDPQNRPCVADIVPYDKYPSLFPVGRLDRLTRGMLIFTTDGDLGQQLLHPKNEVVKKYWAVLDARLEKNSSAFKKIEEGVIIKSGKTSPSKLEILEHFDFAKYLDYEKKFFENCAQKDDALALPNEKDLLNREFSAVNIEIHEGKNRQVRRMFEAVGFNVLLLERKSIGKLKLGSLECGKWAKLDTESVNKMLG